jgi:hypothetical protein
MANMLERIASLEETLAMPIGLKIILEMPL